MIQDGGRRWLREFIEDSISLPRIRLESDKTKLPNYSFIYTYCPYYEKTT